MTDVTSQDPREALAEALRDAVNAIPWSTRTLPLYRADIIAAIENVINDSERGYTIVASDRLDGLEAGLRSALLQWEMYADAERGPGPEHFAGPGEGDYLTWLRDGTDTEAEKFQRLAALSRSEATEKGAGE